MPCYDSSWFPPAHVLRNGLAGPPSMLAHGWPRGVEGDLPWAGVDGSFSDASRQNSRRAETRLDTESRFRAAHLKRGGGQNTY